jgi:hypothetical protein
MANEHEQLIEEFRKQIEQAALDVFKNASDNVVTYEMYQELRKDNGRLGSVLICLFGMLLCLSASASVGTWKALPRSGLGQAVVSGRPSGVEYLLKFWPHHGVNDIAIAKSRFMSTVNIFVQGDSKYPKQTATAHDQPVVLIGNLPGEPRPFASSGQDTLHHFLGIQSYFSEVGCLWRFAGRQSDVKIFPDVQNRRRSVPVIRDSVGNLVVIAEYNVIHEVPGALCAHQSLNIKQCGSRRLSSLPGLPANYRSRYDSNDENPPVRFRPPLGPFDGCVPGWRVATGLGLILSAGGLFVWAVRRNHGWLALGCGAIFFAGSFIWLTGHTDCREAQNRESQRLEHDRENVSLDHGMLADPHALAGIFAVGIGHRKEPLPGAVLAVAMVGARRSGEFPSERVVDIAPLADVGINPVFLVGKSIPIPYIAKNEEGFPVAIQALHGIIVDGFSVNPVNLEGILFYDQGSLEQKRMSRGRGGQIKVGVHKIPRRIAVRDFRRRIPGILHRNNPDVLAVPELAYALYEPRSLSSEDGLGARPRCNRGILSRFGGSLARVSGLLRRDSLPSYSESREDNCPRCNSLRPCYEYVPPGQVALAIISFVLAGVLLFGLPGRWKTKGTTFLACSLIFLGGTMLLAGHKYYCPSDKSTTDYPRKYPDGYSAQSFQHDARIVPQKYLDLM